MANYKTIDGAKQYFRRLAKDFHMSDAAKQKLESCNTVPEIEHVWKSLLNEL